MKRLSYVALLLVPVCLTVAPWVNAEEAAPGEQRGSERQGDETTGVLVVEVDPGTSGLDPKDVRAAVARELGVDVVESAVPGAAGTMTVTIEGEHQATVSFESADRWVQVTRSVELPAEPDQQLETLALLAGNLARNEAGELLAGLKKKEPPAVTNPVPTKPKRVPTGALPPRRSSPTRGASTLPVAPRPCALARKGRDAVRAVNLSLAHPVALEPNSHRYRYHLELGLAYSRTAGISGAGLNLVYLRSDGPLLGAAGSGVLLVTDGPTCGVAWAVVGTLTRGSVAGVDFGGVFALRRGDVQGAQVGGLLGMASGRLEGGQLGAVSFTGGRVDGTQLSGLVSYASGDLRGVQFAGGYNHSSALRGVQLGLFNQAGTVEGVQIGVVNISRKVDGVALGLVNIVTEGRTELVGWMNGLSMATLGVKYQFRHAYTLLGMGGDPVEPATWASYAVGLHLPLWRFFLDFDGMYSFVGDQYLRGIQTFHARHETRARAMLGVALVPGWFALFAGAAAEHGIDTDGVDLGFRPEPVLGIQTF